MRFWHLGVGIETGIRIKELGVWLYGVMSCNPAEGYMSGLEFGYTLDFRISQ